MTATYEVIVSLKRSILHEAQQFAHRRIRMYLMSVFNLTKAYNITCDKKKRDMQSISVSSKLFFNSRLIDQGIGFISDIHMYVHVHVLCVHCITT